MAPLKLLLCALLVALAYSIDVQADNSTAEENHSADSYGEPTFSSRAVAAHSTSGDCWVIVSFVVYDLSNFVDQHPGGAEAITNYCGVDGTKSFYKEGRHPESARHKLR